MQKSQKGFTLIELVVVIVLLGILGVTALAKYQDLSVQATNAAISGIASEVSSSAAINYASFVVGGASTAITVATCTDAFLAPLFAANAFPAGYDASTSVGACGVAGNTYTCSIIDDNIPAIGTAATATIICTG